MIEVNGLTKRYGGFTALEGLNLSAGAGSVYGLVGCNGAGKTTLLKCAAGIYRPEAGGVRVGGRDVYDSAAARRAMFFIPDELFFLPQASMKRMAAFYRGFYPGWSDVAFKKLAALFQLDTKARLNGFSKGMQRQAAIILALATNPGALLLDELFDGLDPRARNLVRQLLLEAIAARGMAVLVSSHNLRELEDLCDRVGVIHRGRLVFEGAVDDLRATHWKYRVVMGSPPGPEGFSALGCSGLKIDGSIATFVARGGGEQTDRALAALNPLLVEKLPMTLEEIFLDEMEVGEYDFSGIFDQESEGRAI